MTSLLDKFTNFGDFSLPIFLFYALISLITFLITRNYFNNKINKLLKYNRSLQEDLNNYTVSNNEVETSFEKNTYIKSSQVFDSDLSTREDIKLEVFNQNETIDDGIEVAEINEAIANNDIVLNPVDEKLILNDINLATTNQNSEVLEDEKVVNSFIENSEVIQKVEELAIAENIITENIQVEESNVLENFDSEPVAKDHFEVIELLPIDQVIGRASNTTIAPVKPNKIDDLKLIEGIGFKIQEILNAKGIHSFEQLASMKIFEIKAILDEAGPRFSFHDPSSWPQQAMLARDGEWPVLRRLQDELDKGKIVK